MTAATPATSPGGRRFVGRVALVTGAGSGIGAAVCARLSAEGAAVVLTGRRPTPLEEVAAMLPGPCLVRPADAAVRSQIAGVVDAAVSVYGSLDVLVANAGSHRPGAVAEVDDASWRETISGNLDSAFLAIAESIPALKASRGSIVTVSSIAGHFAGPEVASYVTTKHALVGLTRSTARDYGRFGIRANVVAPGWVRTAMADEQMDELGRMKGIDREEAYTLVSRDLPLGRAATADEIAALVAFLASDEASIITGATFVADGGAGCVDLPTIAFAPANDALAVR